MSDFLSCTLGDLVSKVVGGGTPARGHRQFWSGDIPWASVKDISSSPRRLLATEESITEAGLRSSAANLVPAGVPLIATRMALGAAALTARPTAINQDLKALYPRSGVDSEFLFYLLENIRSKVEAEGIGSTVKGISVPRLLKLPVQFPSDTATQLRIAEILSTLDEQIERTDAMVEKACATKQGLVRELLAPLSGGPKLILSEVAEVGGGITLGRQFSGPGTAEYPYLRVANVQDGHLDLSEVKTIRIPVGAAARATLRQGDVLMNEGGDFDKLGRGAVWQGQIPNCLHQNHVFRVRCKQDVLLPEFLALWAASDFGKRFFLLASKQSTNLASINSTQLKRFPVLTPALTAQRKVVESVAVVGAVVEGGRQEVEALKLLKVGLLNDLLRDKARPVTNP